MIDKALSFLTQELNSYLQTQFQITDSVVVSSLLSDSGNQASEKQTDKIVITLIHLEHETVSKNRDTGTNYGNQYASNNASININLNILFAATFNDYNESLKFISAVLFFFQMKYVFTHVNSPNLDRDIEKLILDIQKNSYEDMNYIWGMMGSKYLPSVVYKLRMLTIQSNNWIQSVPLVNNIQVNE